MITLDPDSDSDGEKSLRPHKKRKSSHRDGSNENKRNNDNTQPVPSTSASAATAPDANDEKYEIAVTDFVLQDLHAVSILKDTGFKKLVRKLNPECTLPACDAVLNRIEFLYGLKKANLLDQLHDVQHISLSLEQWTSAVSMTYVTIKANFIDANWMPQSFVMTTSPATSLENSREMINDVIRDWNIAGRVVSIVYDTHDVSRMETTETDAFNDSTKLCCFAKTLQWCIDYGLNSIQEIRNLVTKCKKIVTFFQHSVPADIYLLKYQKSLEIPPNQLIQSVTDEINSTYSMLERLRSQRKAIDAVLMDQDIFGENVKAALRLTQAEWTTVANIVDTLEPFQLANEILHSDRSTEDVMSIVKPVIFSICENFLKFDSTDDPTPIHALKKNIKEALQRYFNLYVGSAEVDVPDYQDIATYLDPRYKQQEYLGNDKKRDVVRRYISSKCFPSAQAHASSSLLNRSLQAINLLFPPKSTDSMRNETDEWTRYMSEPEINKNLPPHKWWRLNESIYPNIATIAKIYLCSRVTAKSVWSPRCLNRRTLLPPQDIDKFIFLNHKMA